MNSLQLVSKIRTKADDLHANINEMLHANQELSSLDKELLRKQCTDLYELIIKLKCGTEASEERPIQKIIPQPEIQTELPPEKTEEPVLQTHNFQEVLQWADQNQEPLEEIAAKVEIREPEATPVVSVHVLDVAPEPNPEELEEDLDLPPAPVHEFTTPQHIEVNIGKAVENKRIQKTVMPDLEEPKANPILQNLKDKEPTYNDRMARENPPVMVPLADKTIEAPIDNIKSAINLNRKIAFVNELFRENVVEYAKAIDRLNTAQDLTDALRIHNELKHQLQWENEHELVQELERLIRRRFV